MQMGHVPDQTDFITTCISQDLFIRDLESSLSLDIFVIAQWDHEQSGHGGRDG